MHRKAHVEKSRKNSSKIGFRQDPTILEEIWHWYLSKMWLKFKAFTQLFGQNINKTGENEDP